MKITEKNVYISHRFLLYLSNSYSSTLLLQGHKGLGWGSVCKIPLRSALLNGTVSLWAINKLRKPTTFVLGTVCPWHMHKHLSLECRFPAYACRAILPSSEPSLPPYGYQGWLSRHRVTFLAGAWAIFPVLTFSVINLKAIWRSALPFKKNV